MADGLRQVGSCPRCGGTLVYADAAPEPVAAEPSPAPPLDAVAPHLVLGIPRR